MTDNYFWKKNSSIVLHFCKFVVVYVWLKRRQLDSHTCSCFQPIVTSYVMWFLENSYILLDKKSGKEKHCLCFRVKIVLTLWTP